MPNKLLNFLFWYLHWPKIDKMVGGADVLFMPNINFGTVSQQCRLMLTVHDLSYERMPEHFSLKRRIWHIFINPKRMCQNANRIIAVSNSTKKDVALWYKIQEEKIKVVYNAVCNRFRIIDRNDVKLLEIKEKYKLPFKFILYFGTIEPRKNITGIIRAYNQLRDFAKEDQEENMEKYKLIIAGETGWLGGQIFDEIQKSPYQSDIKIIRSVREADKEYLYNLASLFVFASFFEGFGFPPLEAMKCGVPVIASNNSSLPEVIGRAGILIDPDKPSEIFLAMKDILKNKELKENIVKKGLEQAREFDWRKSAQEFLKQLEK